MSKISKHRETLSKKKKITYSTKYCRNSLDSYGRRGTTLIRTVTIFTTDYGRFCFFSSIYYMYILQLAGTHMACEVALHKSFNKHFCLELNDKLHQIFYGEVLIDGLVLLDDWPSRVLQNLQTHISVTIKKVVNNLNKQQQKNHTKQCRILYITIIINIMHHTTIKWS